MKEPKYKPKKILYPDAGIPLQNRRALALLKSWMAVPDDKGDIWWDEFERDLQGNRFKLRIVGN